MTGRNKKIWILGLLVYSFVLTGFPQEAKVNQSMITREHRKKEKKAQKDYNAAVKRHEKMQSGETRSMMKQSRKEAKKNTPVKPRGKKKCY